MEIAIAIVAKDQVARMYIMEKLLVLIKILLKKQNEKIVPVKNSTNGYVRFIF